MTPQRTSTRPLANHNNYINGRASVNYGNAITARSGQPARNGLGGLPLIGRVLERIGFSDAFTSKRTADVLKTEIALLACLELR